MEWLSNADNIRHGFATNLYSTQKNCKLINKMNNKEYTFMSLSKASCFLGRNNAYISNNLKAGRKVKDTNNQEYNVILL